MTERPPDDDRPPICPACGVTQGLVGTGEGTRFVCLECGFAEGEEAVPGREGEPWDR